MLLTIIEVQLVRWNFDRSACSGVLSGDNVTITDNANGKAWSTALGEPRFANGRVYVEIRVVTCNPGNSIKMVFGVLSGDHLRNLLRTPVGQLGSLQGGCPIGYLPAFGHGSACYWASGAVVVAGQEVAKAEPYKAADLIGMLLDIGARSVQFFKNGVAVAGPLSNALDASAAPVAVAVSLIKANQATIVTAPNLPASLQSSAVPRSTAPPRPSPAHSSSATIPTASAAAAATSNSTCPVCGQVMAGSLDDLNRHIDECLTLALLNIEQAPHLERPQSQPQPPTHTSQPRPRPNQIHHQLQPTLATSPGSSTAPIRSFSPTIDSPFVVVCPYANCEVPMMEATDFAAHAIAMHSVTPFQALACPVCALGGIEYIPTAETNLLRHVTKVHPASRHTPHTTSSSSSSSSSTATAASTQQQQQQQQQQAALAAALVADLPKLGAGYLTSVLHESILDQECPICLEEFLCDQTTARLECWCLFHQHCVEAYFKRVEKRQCPIHSS